MPSWVAANLGSSPPVPLLTWAFLASTLQSVSGLLTPSPHRLASVISDPLLPPVWGCLLSSALPPQGDSEALPGITATLPGARVTTAPGALLCLLVSLPLSQANRALPLMGGVLEAH